MTGASPQAPRHLTPSRENFLFSVVSPIFDLQGLVYLVYDFLDPFYIAGCADAYPYVVVTPWFHGKE